MASPQRPHWEVRVHGEQLDEPDIDLLAQIVIMLGRQLADEATENEDNHQREESDE